MIKLDPVIGQLKEPFRVYPALMVRGCNRTAKPTILHHQLGPRVLRLRVLIVTPLEERAMGLIEPVVTLMPRTALTLALIEKVTFSFASFSFLHCILDITVHICVHAFYLSFTTASRRPRPTCIHVDGPQGPEAKLSLGRNRRSPIILKARMRVMSIHRTRQNTFIVILF